MSGPMLEMLEFLKTAGSVLAGVYLLLGISVFSVLMVQRVRLDMPAVQVRLYLFGRLALATSNEFWALVMILFLWPVVQILVFDNSSPDPSGRETIDNITVRSEALSVVARSVTEGEQLKKVA